MKFVSPTIHDDGHNGPLLESGGAAAFRDRLRESIDHARECLPQRRLLAGLLCLSLGGLLGAVSYRAHAAPVFPGPLLRRFL